LEVAVHLLGLYKKVLYKNVFIDHCTVSLYKINKLLNNYVIQSI